MRLPRSENPRPRLLHSLSVVLLLLVLYAQLILSAGHNSSTMDELYHIFNGVTWFLSDQPRVVIMGNPPLINILEAAPIVALDKVRLPADPSFWTRTHWRDILEDLVYPFLWEVNGDRAHRLIFLAQLPVIGLTLVLAVGVYHWSRDLLGPAGGLLALVLFAFDPNILAHGRLATSDLGAACSMLWAAYLFWRYRAYPNWQRCALAGLALGFALASKFSAVLLLPALVFLGLWPTESQGWSSWSRTIWQRGTGLLGILVIALLVLLGTFRFDVSALQGEFDYQWMHLKGGHAAFLMGQYGSGWWYYFPVAFVLKTPIPLMILVVIGSIALHSRRRDLAFLLLPPLTVLVASLFSKIDIGYRYLLPMLPFLIIVASGAWILVHTGTRGPTHLGRYVIAALLLIWYVLGTLSIYPHYLAYFNIFAGGPDGGWRYLVDSNLDWGQDLPGLRAYMEARGLAQVYLSWFGTSPPERYGIRYVPLPSAFSSRTESRHRAYHPQYPPPGVYAISATNLQGVYLSDRDTFAWFRDREPTAKIGYSIFIYEVPSIGGQPISVCLSGMSVDQVDQQAFTQALGTNDIRLCWFDARGALVLPAGGRDVWFLTTDEKPFDPLLQDKLLKSGSVWGQRYTVRSGLSYTLYHLPGDVIGQVSASAPADLCRDSELHGLSLPVDFGSRLAFLGYELTDTLYPGDEVALLTFWRVEQPFELPLALFVHMLDSAGQILGQHDGLSIDPEGMQRGDVFLQVHRFSVPHDVPAGEYPLEIGVYQPETGQRWNVYEQSDPVSDRLLLHSVIVKAE